MSTADMLNRVKLQPHLVRLIASLRWNDVELAVALLLDYIDAGQAVPADTAPVPFTRSPFRNGWTTFNVRDEHADEAARRLAGSTPAAPESGGEKQ